MWLRGPEITEQNYYDLLIQTYFHCGNIFFGFHSKHHFEFMLSQFMLSQPNHPQPELICATRHNEGKPDLTVRMVKLTQPDSPQLNASWQGSWFKNHHTYCQRPSQLQLKSTRFGSNKVVAQTYFLVCNLILNLF